VLLKTLLRAQNDDWAQIKMHWTVQIK